MGIADLAVGAGDLTLVTIGLGSCVAIALHDAECGVGGLAHILLPHSAHSAAPVPSGKVPASAVPAMVTRMRAMGSTGEVRARLIGGASMFAPLLPVGAIGLGARNVQACRQACASFEIPVSAEAVGGRAGRSVYFDVRSGRIHVRTIRDADVVL